MGLSFEADLRRAEQTINNLIAACKRSGDAVYIGNKDKTGFCAKLEKPICITYFHEISKREGAD